MASEIEKRIKAAQIALVSLEKKRKSRMFMFIERERDHICLATHARVFLKRHDFQNIDTLEILLHSPGGHPNIAYQVVKFFRRHCKRLNVIVPMMAKSAATLMCLVADTIYMSEHAELGPLDVQIEDPIEKGMLPFSPLDEFKSMEFLREYATEMLDYFTFLLIERSGMSVKEALHEAIPAVTGMVSPLYAKIDPSKIGSYRRSLAIGEEYAKRLLKLRKHPKWEELAETLVWKYPSHDFTIDREEALGIGLPVQPLDNKQEDSFIEIISAMLQSGEPTYAFAKKPVQRTKTTKKRVQTDKQPSSAPQEKLKAV
jgi:Serine dehydrogenase proteinase